MTNNPFIPSGANNTTTPAPMPGPTAPMPGASAGNASDTFEVDLTDVQEGYTIPDGVYKARCVELEQSVSQAGNPMFVWSFVITDGPYTGKSFKSWTAITPAAMWKIAETVQALGIGQTGQVVRFKRADVINRDCGLLIEADEYNGKPSSKVSRVVSMQEYKSQV